MFTEFKSHNNANLPFLKESKLLIAISGGLDSVVLTHLCHSLKLNVALAHCNFNLRANESDADEQFVLDLAETLDLEVFIESFDTEDYAKTQKLSTQMAARELRYDWFNELAKQLKFDYVLTAHHADDNLETFLINLTRGSGLDGLTGIPEQNGKIVRPLLGFSRETIEVYAKDHNIKWREDASNASDKYLRNALRHHIVPKLKELNPHMLQNFEKTRLFLNDAQDIVKDRIEDISKSIISEDPHGNLILNISKIKALSNPEVYLFQLLKDYGFTAWDDVFALLKAQAGKQVLSSTHRLVKNRNELILNSIEIISEEVIAIKKNCKEAPLANGILFFDEADALFGKRSNVAFVDKDLLKFPLTVRGWQEGDYFYPAGMQGKKKLSKYFKDEKLSLLDKENISLLCSGEDIIWIIDKRADERFKITDATKHILKITYKK